MQIARAKAVKAEFIKQAEHHAKEGRKVADVLADGVIVGVGLIQRDQSGEGKHK
jgi:NADH dehydrogenase (ubiquinone) Fe-S protein 5